MTLAARFFDKVRVGDFCWEWTAGKFDNGYGQFRAGAHKVKAHRMAWMLEHGPIPEGLCVLHHCDNRACVRPSHLFLGTHADNMADRNAKGRQAKGQGSCGARGERHASARLTEKQVRELRARHEAGESTRTLAKKFGVHHSNVWSAVRRQTWAHVDSDAPKRGLQ